LFTGAAGSGESEIRRWIIENDWLEGIVALPDQLFYNTGISTYFWVLTNRKRPERRGQVPLVDARELFVKMGKSLGEKRKQISQEQIAEVSRRGLRRVERRGHWNGLLPEHAAAAAPDRVDRFTLPDVVGAARIRLRAVREHCRRSQHLPSRSRTSPGAAGIDVDKDCSCTAPL
jgi:type I restriction-modification system DNA methylase subunit